MKKRPVRQSGMLALFATFLVVGGVVFAAILATPKIAPDAYKPPSAESPTDSPEATSTGRVLVIDNEGTRLFANGESKTLSWPEDVKLLGRAVSQIVGVDAFTGERVYLASGFARATSTGIHSPDGRRSLHPSSARADGTGSIEVRLGSESRTFVTRLPNGKAIKDVMPLGWWDNETVVLAGRVTSTRSLFAVSLTGSASLVASFPDMAQRISVIDGAVWHVTAEAGEGLEAVALPPSELHRVSRNGNDERVIQDGARVIAMYTVSGNNVAYSTDDGEINAKTEMGALLVGKGAPLAFMDPTHLLVRQAKRIFMKDIVTGLESTVFVLTDDGAIVFVLPPADTSTQK
ncbi:MAG: hypothetical protein WC787_01410 [Patescibacteria group bacterium]|jgi:hypothetical protein